MANTHQFCVYRDRRLKLIVSLQNYIYATQKQSRIFKIHNNVMHSLWLFVKVIIIKWATYLDVLTFTHYYFVYKICLAFIPSSHEIQRSPLVRKHATACLARWWIQPSSLNCIITASIQGYPVWPWIYKLHTDFNQHHITLTPFNTRKYSGNKFIMYNIINNLEILKK